MSKAYQAVEAVAGRRRDCRCLRVRHAHGTLRAYETDLCRCGPCMAAAATGDLDRLAAERDACSDPYAKTAKTDRESRAAALLKAGLHPGRVAEMTGMTLGAVDRLAGVEAQPRAGDATVPHVSQRARVRKSA